ncbi:duboraya isoform X2 [Anoplopoma fimbria]|uniref:duboraya isoform X2 n=1 Tax=Anoplopoma fimbria TaxID=229290 RepID=UPI0023EDF3D4|nr:duboraya isoform X2 [Anoplopoma fimbria]
MEEEAPSRPSVAELAGRFKGSTRPHDAAGNEAEKPVRRRPPRSLQLNKTPGDDQEPPGVTSSLPAKAKRNSALIEKLQANLALSPTGLLPSPMSPGFRLLPYAFTPLPQLRPCFRVFFVHAAAHQPGHCLAMD